MVRPELVVLAAGMGSRYGGLKQIDAVDDQGHIIIDFSIYDAIKAGFKDITFIIKHEIEADFREIMDKHLAGKDVNVKYVFQQIDMLRYCLHRKLPVHHMLNEILFRYSSIL